MAYPTKPALDYSYTGFQQSQGDNSFPGTQFDNDLNGLKQSLDQQIDFTTAAFRSDGKLKNQSVGRDQLAADVLIGFNAARPWETGTDYVVNDTVFVDDGFYVCLIAHTAGADFAVDLAGGRWALLADFAAIAADAEAAADAAAASAAAADSSAEDAEAAQSAASASASAADASEAAAAGSAAAASGSAGTASAAASAAEAARDAVLAEGARFLEPSATPPALRDDGSALQAGDRYMNTGDSLVYIRNAANDDWVASSGAPMTPFGASLVTALNSTSALTSPLTFVRTGVGPVAMPVHTKLAAVLDAREFGVVADGVADDTAAINLALAYSETHGLGPVRLPAGTIKVSGALAVDGNGNGLVGAGRGATIIAPSNATGNCIEIGDGSSNPANILLSDLSIIPSVTRSAGYAISVDNGHNICLFRFVLAGPHSGGLKLDGGAQQYLYYIENYEIGPCSGTGIHVGDGYAQGVFLRAGIIATCEVGLLVTHASGLVVSGLDMIQCEHGITFFPENSLGRKVQFGFFTHVVIDTCVGAGSGWEFFGDGPICDITLTNCWSASHPEHGIYIANTRTNGISINSTRIIANQKSGISITAGKNVAISDCQIFCNSMSGSGAFPGIGVDANVSHFRIVDCDIGAGGIGETLTGNLQNYGIVIVAGSGDHSLSLETTSSGT